MNMAFTFQPLISIPWGDKDDEIPLTLVDYPNFAFVSSEQMRKVPAPVRIRLGANGSIHVLADAPLRTKDAPVFIQHFDERGKRFGTTLVPFPDRRETEDVFILDYAIDADGNCYLLERIQSDAERNRLRKINLNGQVQWSRIGPINEEQFDFSELSGTFKRLLMDGNSRLYLPATEHTGAIAEIDRDTGQVAHVYTSDKSSSQVLMTEGGTVVYVLYFPDLNRRGVGFLNLNEHQVTSVVGGVDLYGWLLYPIGVDGSSSVYAWKDSAVARISSNAQINVIAEFDNVVVRSSDGNIFTSLMRSDQGQSSLARMTRHAPDGQVSHQELRIPSEISGRPGAKWKLIHVDEQEKYYVFGGEEPGHAGTVLVYSRDGELETTTSRPGDLLSLESRLENYSFWQVDSRGRIYLPVTDAQGFKVLRLSTVRFA